MKIGVLSIGSVDDAVLLRLQEGLTRVFPDTSCVVVEEELPVSKTAFDKERKQHRSHAILSEVQGYAVKKKERKPRFRRGGHGHFCSWIKFCV